MDLLEMPVTLVVKAPNQKIADQTVECALDWTIRKLKSHLSTVYPSQPKEHQQRIIYSGKLLQDEMKLKDILRHVDEDRVYTVHLVCSTPEFMTTASNMSENTNGAESEGLRHRHTAVSSSSTMPSTSVSMSRADPTPSAASQPVTSTQDVQSTQSIATPLPGMDTMAAMYQGAGQFGYAGQLGAMAGMMPGMPYSPEQMLWLQQIYTQQLAQYMNYYQQGGMPVAATPLSADPQPANQNPGVAAQPGNQAPERNQPIVMNAAGEALLDDDEDENGNRDWLDWLYTLSRFAVLLGIVYFYSTFSRFLMVLGLFVFIYMYQAGWFALRRDDRQQEQREQQENRENVQNAENVQRESAEGEQTDDSREGEGNRTELDTSHLSIIRTLINFVVLFFTSLIPSRPPPVNAN